MKYIKDLTAGRRIAGIYLCKYKQGAVTKNGKPYDNVTLMDKTGVLNGKVWDPDAPGIGEFEDLDYIDVVGDLTNYNGALQISIKRVRRANEGEYDPKDYLPSTTKDTKEMFSQILGYCDSVSNPYLKKLLHAFFIEDTKLMQRFRTASAAKSVHHGFIGGLLEHTLSVTNLCSYMAEAYPVLNRDLLITASLLHDIGKTRELSPFPKNDYTDDGQMLGHITMGAEMIHDKISAIKGFPPLLETKLKHCILAHHGELEYGSPKKPELVEAMALNLADNTDAKMETMKEILEAHEKNEDPWMGYNRMFEANLRKTGDL